MPQSPTRHHRTVLITGASSGIGHACVARMSADGWSVFAAVRRQEDGDALIAAFGSCVHPVLLDLEQNESILDARKQVNEILDGKGLYGLVNVAGIGMVRPMEYASHADLEKVFSVNVFGQLAMVQTFLPLLRKTSGRIVNISSVGAHIAIPFGGLLNGSKAAFGLISDALRLELSPFGVRVCTVEPGSIKTPAVGKTLGDVEKILRHLPPPAREQYGSMLRTFVARAYQRESSGSPPTVVANAVYHALTSPRPPIRYVVGKDARALAALARFLPDGILDHIRTRLFGLDKPLNPA